MNDTPDKEATFSKTRLTLHAIGSTPMKITAYIEISLTNCVVAEHANFG
jgi:hypothetical protein